MFQPGIWGKDEIISAVPTRCPDGEIGQGKEIGELEGTQAWNPKCGEQSPVDRRQFCFTPFERLCSAPGLQLSPGNVPRGEAILLLL